MKISQTSHQPSSTTRLTASQAHFTTMGVILLVLAAFDLAHSSPNCFGKDFITAFPENIAFYHPTKPNNRILVTALTDTWVTVTMMDPGFHDTYHLAAGQPQEFLSYWNGMELARSKFSNQTLRVNSTNDISVLAISQRGDSIQTAVVPPVQTLDTEYCIPPIPDMNSSQMDPANSLVTDINLPQPQADLSNCMFRIIIINHNQTNEVNVSGPAGVHDTVSLQPFQLVQLWVNGSQSEQRVLADFPVAVLYSHPCAAVTQCSCRFLVLPVYPASAWGSEYLVPSLEDESVNMTTFLLTTTQAVTLLGGPPTEQYLPSSQELPFYPSLPGGSDLVKTSSPVFLTLNRPGLLLNLMPTASFSACYFIYALQGHNNQVLLIAPTGQTGDVHDESTAMTLTWSPMTGTEYSWGLADLGAQGKRHIIWHGSSKIAAYYLGDTNGKVFGNPATSLSTFPDSKGCMLMPELVTLGDKQEGWPESLNFCQNLGYSLVSLNTQEILLRVAKKLREAKVQAHGQGWIGLRRSSLTGQWYWLSKQDVSFTHWDVDEPGTPLEGQCTMMTLDPQGNYTWSDQSCCEALQAVCYKAPIYFSLQ